MCGICGFTVPAGSENTFERQSEIIDKMCQVIAHRGPDGEGRLLNKRVVLGHRRLSLIDIEGGAQPMSRSGDKKACTQVAHDIYNSGVHICEAGDYQIVFNGEIYNFRDLRDELVEKGYSFDTDSDTEVLLVSYICWGSECVSKLRGMFAFAVYDAQSNKLFCARDGFGIKPFYWTCADDGAFVFASEIKSVLKYPFVEKTLNYRAFEQYLSFQYSALDETFFAGIYKLAPGHLLEVDLASGKINARRWFLPSFDIDDTLDMGIAADKIHDAVQQSVSYHKIADVEVGSFLSSGVDSNYLAASLASQSAGILTFTVGFETADGQKYNEIDYAKDAADYLGVKHISHIIGEEEFWADFPRIQWHMDEPLADPAAAALWFVDKEAAKHVKAVLSGEGADEFFGGYPIYQTTVENKKISWFPRPVLRWAASILDKLHIRGANYLRRAATPIEERFIGNANIFSVEEREKILVPNEQYTHLPPAELLRGTYLTVNDNDDTAKMQYVDLCWWLVGDILLKTDKMSMAHSLESRVPYLDKEVWAVARTLPERLRVSHDMSKIALRQAAEKLMPADYTEKPKLGFPVPIRVWLAQDKYCDKVREVFESDVSAKFFDTREAVKLLDDHKTGKADNSRKIWTLYSFLVWYEQYFGEE